MKYLLRIAIVACLGLFCSVAGNAQAADVVVAKKTTELAKNLDLSVDQTAKVEKVFASYKEKQNAIEKISPNAEENDDKLTALDASLMKELSAILTPEQLEKWKSMQPQG